MPFKTKLWRCLLLIISRQRFKFDFLGSIWHRMLLIKLPPVSKNRLLSCQTKSVLRLISERKFAEWNLTELQWVFCCISLPLASTRVLVLGFDQLFFTVHTLSSTLLSINLTNIKKFRKKSWENWESNLGPRLCSFAMTKVNVLGLVQKFDTVNFCSVNICFDNFG